MDSKRCVCVCEECDDHESVATFTLSLVQHLLFPHCCEDPMTSINAVSFFPDGLHSIWQRLVNLHQSSKHLDLRLPASAYLSDQTYLANLGGHKEADQLTST